jgi:hypothetical protein
MLCMWNREPVLTVLIQENYLHPTDSIEKLFFVGRTIHFNLSIQDKPVE